MMMIITITLLLRTASLQYSTATLLQLSWLYLLTIH